MIGRAAGSVLDWYGSRRRRQLEAIWRDPAGVQERALRRLTATARDTEFGLAHGFREHPLGGRVPGAGAGAGLRPAPAVARARGRRRASRSHGRAGAGTG